MDYICTAERDHKEDDLAASYRASPLAAANATTLAALREYPSKDAPLPSEVLAAQDGKKGTRWWQWSIVGQLKALLRFRALADLKSPGWWFSRVITIFINAFIVSTLYAYVAALPLPTLHAWVPTTAPPPISQLSTLLGPHVMIMATPVAVVAWLAQ